MKTLIQQDRHKPPKSLEPVTAQCAVDLKKFNSSDAVFRSVVEAVPDALVIVNDHGEIILVNAQTERLFGYKCEELLRHPAEMLLPERFRGKDSEGSTVFATRPNTLAKEAPAYGELCGLRKDGSEFPVEISQRPAGDAGRHSRVDCDPRHKRARKCSGAVARQRGEVPSAGERRGGLCDLYARPDWPHR